VVGELVVLEDQVVAGQKVLLLLVKNPVLHSRGKHIPVLRLIKITGIFPLLVRQLILVQVLEQVVLPI
jgi:hypothetical protein